MKPGLFFKPDAHTPPGSPLVLFSYKRLMQNGVYPIYVALEHTRVSFFFHSTTGKEHIRLFSLHYSDFHKPNGKLSREIEGLRKNPLRTLLTQSLKFNKFFDDLPSYSSAYIKLLSHHPQWDFSLKLGHRIYQESTQICLVSLLLDFLYDSKQSEVFSLSAHYENWLHILRENTLLDAIFTKVDFLYKRAIEESINSKSAHAEATLASQALQRAEEKWLERITTSTSGSVIAESEWFENSLEKESRYVLSANRRVSLTHPYALGIDTLSHSVEWLITRFNYQAAGTLLLKTHFVNRVILLLICSSPILYILAQYFTRNGYSGWLVAGGFLLALSFLGGILVGIAKIMGRKNKESHKKINLQTYNTILYLSPQLIIAIFLAWWGVRETIHTESLSLELVVWACVLDLILIPAFLFKIIKDQAPDLQTQEVIWRIVLITFRVSFFILIIGFIIFDLLYYGNLSSLSGEYYLLKFPPLLLSYEAILKQFPLVFLSSVFIGSIFRGKIFTGWYPRSLGK